MSLATLMIHTCNVISRTATRGASGGQVMTETTTHTSMKCRVKEMKPEDVAILAKDDILAKYKIYFVTDPGVKRRDIIVWNGMRLEVKLWYNPHDLDKIFKVYADAIKDE